MCKKKRKKNPHAIETGLLESKRRKKIFHHVELRDCVQCCDIRQETLSTDKNNQLISIGGLHLKVSAGTSIDEQCKHVENKKARLHFYLSPLL